MSDDGVSGWLVVVLIFMYFVPSIVASTRRHPSESAIAMMNLLLGWTGVFWLWSFFWALSGAPGKKPEPSPKAEAGRRIVCDSTAGKFQCPWCFGEIDPRAEICPHCRKALQMVSDAPSTTVTIAATVSNPDSEIRGWVITLVGGLMLLGVLWYAAL